MCNNNGNGTTCPVLTADQGQCVLDAESKNHHDIAAHCAGVNWKLLVEGKVSARVQLRLLLLQVISSPQTHSRACPAW